MFSEERFINNVFDSCCAITSTGAEFNTDAVISNTYEAIVTDEDGYWQRRSVIDSLSIIEGMKLISGRIKPEYTKNKHLLKEVRYGRITLLGRVFGRLPVFARCFAILTYRRWKRLLSTLAFLAFIHLCYRAYIGVTVLAGWLEYVAVAILLYIIFLVFSRVISGHS